MKKILILLFIVLLLGITFADDFYPTTVSGLKTEARLHGFGTITGLKNGEEISFQTITFPDSSFQKIKVLREVLYIDGKTILPTYTIDEFENKHVNFKIPYNGKFTYELVAEVDTTALIYEMRDYNLGDVDESVAEFLKRSEKVESDSTQILTLTKNKLYSNSFFESLTATIFWVNDYVEYAKGDEFNQYYLLQKSAIDTLTEKKGVCDEFSNLAAAMLRAKGIPTRLAIGITYDGKKWGNHAWLEVYHNEFGWIPSDPTFRESGFVDATHIRLGSFSDVSLSVAKASYPSTASITFQTQTLPEVKVIDKNYFSHVSLVATNTEFLANQWNEFPVKIKNLTNTTLIVPIKIRETYTTLLVDEKVKSIMLNKGEEREVIFNVYPNLSLASDEIASGTLTFDSLNAPYEKDFTIKPSAGLNNGEVKVLDVTPIAFEDILKLDIKLANLTSENQTISIALIAPDGNKYWEDNSEAFTVSTLSKEIKDYTTGEYLLIIDTLTQKYIQYIYPVKSKSQVVVIPPNHNQVVQKVNTLDDGKDIGLTGPIFIGLVLLTVITLALIFLFATKKRYI